MDRVIRNAGTGDVAAVLGLLKLHDLPTDGVVEHIDLFVVVTDDLDETAISGVAGLEIYGHQGLLRSVCVRSDMRSQGLGSTLVDHMLRRADTLGVREVYLLTTTAADYFLKKGFLCISRSDVTGPVLDSLEFTSVCPASATVMVRRHGKWE